MNLRCLPGLQETSIRANNVLLWGSRLHLEGHSMGDIVLQPEALLHRDSKRPFKKKKKKKKIVNFTLVLGHFNGEVLLAAGCSSCISLAPAATAAAATHLMVLWEGLIQPTLGWSFMAKVVCCRHLLFLSPFSLFSFLWFSLSHGFFPDHFFFFFFFASSFLLTPLPPLPGVQNRARLKNQQWDELTMKGQRRFWVHSHRSTRSHN